MNAADRFFVKLEPARDGSGCLLWTGAKIKGYGQFTDGGRPFQAHRWLLGRVYDIPIGWHVDHLCGNPSCVRPLHLEIVTQAENLRRRHAARPVTHCRNGHEYTDENTYRWRGHRMCRTCLTGRAKAWKKTEAGRLYHRNYQRTLRAKRKESAP